MSVKSSGGERGRSVLTGRFVKDGYSLGSIRVLVERWQPRLGLKHWDVATTEGGLDHDDSILEIERHENAHRAVLHVAPWLTAGDWDAAQTSEVIDDGYVERAVVHELCHLLFRDVMFPMRDDLQDFMGQVAHEVFMRQMHRAEEAAVDGLAQALVASWPERDAR